MRVAVVGRGPAFERAVRSIGPRAEVVTVDCSGEFRVEGARGDLRVFVGKNEVRCHAAVVAIDVPPPRAKGERTCLIVGDGRGASVWAMGEAKRLVEGGGEAYVVATDVLAYGLHELDYLEAQRAGVRFVLGQAEVGEGGRRVQVVERGREIVLEVDEAVSVDLGPGDHGPSDGRNSLDMEVAASPSSGVHLIPGGLPADEAGGMVEAAVAGLFRSYASREVAVVDAERCSACLTCVRTCVHSAPRMEEGRATIDPQACRGCGLCVSLCPCNAISLVEVGE